MSPMGLAYLILGIGTVERFNALLRQADGRGGVREMEDFARAMTDFVRDHQAWAAPIVLLLAFGESLAFISLLIPDWGVLSIFIGRFFGPLRASVPLAAGIFEMPYWRFQFANFVSALVWSAALLLFGDVIAQVLEWLWRVV